MEIVYKDKALADIAHWRKSGQKTIQKKISNLIEDISKHPATGIGKPEQLKHELTGLWSRHITREHRVIYEFTSSKIIILSLKGHYLK